MKVVTGDCLEVLKGYPDNHFTTIVTDPPYGLSFMGKKWDYDVPSIDIWKECLRVLKPGGTMLCFAGSRTQHRMAVNVEDAGFIIKDCLMWIYGSGFPKSLNIGKAVDKLEGNEREIVKTISSHDITSGGLVGKEYSRQDVNVTKGTSDFEGYGTALKPAYEPIIMCMKPNDGTYSNNALKHGVAGINIDAGRIETDDKYSYPNGPKGNGFHGGIGRQPDGSRTKHVEINHQGRFPSNIILDEEAGQMLDEQTGILKSGGGDRNSKGKTDLFNGFGDTGIKREFLASQGGASRFFYSAKASKSERNAGCEGLEEKAQKITNQYNMIRENGTMREVPKPRQNSHPTVKPIKLMEYLIKLVMPPKDGLLLDPFAGSGTTLVACARLGYNGVGIEKEEEYSRIARARLGMETK